MVDLCKIIIIGNLGKDPELRYTPAGKPVTTFSVAVNRYTTDTNRQRIETTEWFRVVAFDHLAQLCDELVSRGSRVYVEGRFKTRNWTGSDGLPRLDMEILATNVIALSPRRERFLLDESSSNMSASVNSLVDNQPHLGGDGS